MPLKLRDGVTLYISRHGETVANIEKRFSGAKDTPLTDKGREQAHAIGETLRDALGMKPQIAFVSSPLQRARTTMEIIRGEIGLPAEGYATDPRIQEINLGSWDQLTDAQARALDPALYDKRMADKWNVRVPGGENYEEVAARAGAWARSVTADTFAVSHGALTRILRGLFSGLDWHAMSALDEPQGVVFRIRGSQVTRLDL
jgi:probable phosphoglycerate mutase